MFIQCHWNGDQEFSINQICALIVIGLYQINESDFGSKYFPSRYMLQFYVIGIYFDTPAVRIILESGFQPKLSEPKRKIDVNLRGLKDLTKFNENDRIQLLTGLAWQPLALQRLAANVIRTSLQPNAVAGLPNLDIPPILKPYIIHGLNEETFTEKFLGGTP